MDLIKKVSRTHFRIPPDRGLFTEKLASGANLELFSVNFAFNGWEEVVGLGVPN